MLDAIYKLRLSDLEKIRRSEKSSPLLLTLYEFLWKSPIIETNKMVPVLSASYNTVAKAIDTLCRLRILEQIDSKARYRRFGYRCLLDFYPNDKIE